MSDNINKEDFDIPSNSPNENLPDEIISPNDSLHQKQEPENMEVHHHAHHEGKKNWKSYIWEFLMLFLAVFCGFLAEYQLEHVIEQNREKQFIKLMIADLESDSLEINSISNEIDKRL